LINLPHTLDLIEITSFRPGDAGFVYEVGSKFPPKAGEYIIADAIKQGRTISNGALVINKTDLEGNGLSTLVDNDSYQLRYRSISSGIPIDLSILSSVKVPDDVSYVNFLNSNGWPLTVNRLTVNIVAAGGQITLKRFEGKFIERIDCLVTQLSRSLDERYSERFLITTNSVIKGTTRDLYVIPVEGKNSGIISNIGALKIERLQNYNLLSTLISQSYPASFIDEALDVEELTYSDIDGQSQTLEIPRVIE